MIVSLLDYQFTLDESGWSGYLDSKPPKALLALLNSGYSPFDRETEDPERPDAQAARRAIADLDPTGEIWKRSTWPPPDDPAADALAVE